MKYTHSYTVRWHDTDASREVRPSQILAYMQETSNYHLTSCGKNLDELRDRHGLAFLLSRISMRMYRPLHTGDEITVETWVCEGRGLSFHRCFRILRGAEAIAEAYTIWALLDMREQKLLPVTAFPYDIEPDEPLDKSFLARVRMPAPGEMQEVGARRIVYSDLDYNGHMNNTRYPDMLCDFTPSMQNYRAVGVSLSFLQEAAFENTLKVFRAERPLSVINSAPGSEFLFRTLNEEGKVCLEAALQVEKR